MDSATPANKHGIEAVEHVPARQHRGDKAAEILSKNPEGRIIVTPEQDRRVLRRIDMVILPIMLGVYFLQALDKATLAYSSVFGLIGKFIRFHCMSNPPL